MVISTMLCLVAAISSCKKDHTKDLSVQRPDLRTSKVLIDVINQTNKEDDVVSQVFLYRGNSLGSGFPIERNKKIELSTSTLGKGTLNVIINGSANNSVTVIDSDSTLQCKNIATSGQTLVSFDNVNLQLNQRVTITYHSAPCQ